VRTGHGERRMIVWVSSQDEQLVWKEFQRHKSTPRFMRRAGATERSVPTTVRQGSGQTQEVVERTAMTSGCHIRTSVGQGKMKGWEESAKMMRRIGAVGLAMATCTVMPAA